MCICAQMEAWLGDIPIGGGTDGHSRRFEAAPLVDFALTRGLAETPAEEIYAQFVQEKVDHAPQVGFSLGNVLLCGFCGSCLAVVLLCTVHVRCGRGCCCMTCTLASSCPSCVIAASQSGAASDQLASSGHTPAVCHPDLLHSGSDSHSHRRRSTSKDDWWFQHARPCLQKLLASPGRGRGADVNSGRAGIAGVGRSAASGGGERPPSPLCPHLSWMPLAYGCVYR